MVRQRTVAIGSDSEGSYEPSDSAANEKDSDGVSPVADASDAEAVWEPHATSPGSRNRLRRAAANSDSPKCENAKQDEDPQTYPVTLRVGTQVPSAKKRKHDSDEDDPEYQESDSEAPSDSDDSEKIYSRAAASDSAFEDEMAVQRRQRRRARNRQRELSRTSRHLLRERARRESRRRKHRGFVIDDDDDDANNSEDAIADMYGEGLVDELEEEIEELKEEGGRHKRIFRRGLPAPVPAEFNEAAALDEQARAALAASRGRPRASEIRRLFNVRGPFGGAGVVSLFNPRQSDLQELLGTADTVVSSNSGSEQAAATFGASTAADADPLGTQGVDFDQVGGLDSYVDKLKEMVQLPLLYPEVYTRFGITPPRGVLFHGPPGTGKTLMARALAGSIAATAPGGRKVAFFMRKGADVMSKWVGEAERQLRVLFDEAKAAQPSIIFFDEIDGLAPVRSAKQEQIHSSIVSTLLALMDGMDNRGQVVVIGATNRPDSVDPALRRPGRFDREFYFGLPNLEARQRILEIHTRGWPQLPDGFLAQVAHRTAGYGGADLRSLCTEAALSAIQRQFPQIYSSERRLAIDPQMIMIAPEDFAMSLDRVQPSASREKAGLDGSNGVPEHVAPLLESSLMQLMAELEDLLPLQSPKGMPSATPSGATYEQQSNIAAFKRAQIHRPRLLVSGNAGNGQEYIVPALTQKLDGVFCQVLDLTALYGDVTTTPETALIQLVSEARKRTPACIMVPQLESWSESPLENTLTSLLGNLLPTEAILVVGIATDSSGFEKPHWLTGAPEVRLQTVTNAESLASLFSNIFEFVRQTPLECREPAEVPPLPLPKLPEAPILPETVQGSANASRDLETSLRQDMRTRSQLKVKLGALMEVFKSRYRRFRKPVVDDFQLTHLFESIPTLIQPEYVRTPDDMILEKSSGRKFYNMDLDVVEDRLWNGYYCEPRQFLDDIEMIHADAVESGDRERMHKASEMLANAQVGVDDISDPAFLRACRDLRVREAKRILEEIMSEGPSVVGLDRSQDPDVVRKDISASKPSEDTNGEVATVTVPAVDFLPNSSKDAEDDNSQPKSDETAPAQVHIHEENGNTELIVERGTVAEVDAAEAAAEQALECDADADAVASSEISYHAALEYDESIAAAFRQDLIERSMNRNLDELEIVRAELARKAWKLRLDWNRNHIFAALGEVVKLYWPDV